MTRIDDILAEIKQLPREARLDYIARLPKEDRELVRVKLSPDDRKKLNAHMERVAHDSKPSDREVRLAEAMAGNARDVADMITALYEIESRLTPSEKTWVERIDRTASGFDNGIQFTARQQKVICEIYAKWFRSGVS